jgi:hypothetical protein
MHFLSKSMPEILILRHSCFQRIVGLFAPCKGSALLTATSSGAHVLRATSMQMKNEFMLSLIFQCFIKIFVSYISEIWKIRVIWYCTYRALYSVINLYNQTYVHKCVYTHTHRTLVNLHVSARHRCHHQGIISLGNTTLDYTSIANWTGKHTLPKNGNNQI